MKEIAWDLKIVRNHERGHVAKIVCCHIIMRDFKTQSMVGRKNLSKIKCVGIENWEKS